MPYLELPDCRLHYVVDDHTDPWTRPDTVLFVHGFTESTEAWRGWVPHFSRRYRVVRIDQRGFGQEAGQVTFAHLPIRNAVVEGHAGLRLDALQPPLLVGFGQRTDHHVRHPSGGVDDQQRGCHRQPEGHGILGPQDVCGRHRDLVRGSGRAVALDQR